MALLTPRLKQLELHGLGPDAHRGKEADVVDQVASGIDGRGKADGEHVCRLLQDAHNPWLQLSPQRGKHEVFLETGRG